MGLDGGTIISRNDVLRGQCWDLNKADDSRSTRGGAVRGTFKRRKLDSRTSTVTRWSTCALSSQPLAPPVVACFLGRLYNKSAVLEWLLARAGRFGEEGDVARYLNQLREGGEAFDHIASLRDVFAVHYTPAAADSPALAAAAGGSSDAELAAPCVCPITSLRCDRHPFVALRGCGHVLAQRALNQAGRDGTCPLCSAAWQPDDVVPLVPGEEQLERLAAQLPLRRKQAKRKGGRKQAQQHAQQRQGDDPGEQQHSGEQRREGDGVGGGGRGAAEEQARPHAGR